MILNAVFLTTSATSVIFPSGIFERAERTTPGPDTPTLITLSGSPAPWNAPAINGLSSGALQNTTSFDGPTRPLSLVRTADSRTIFPIRATASIFIPAFVEPMLTLEQSLSVTARASGMLLISSSSPFANPFCTSAEYPPKKFTPTAFAALSRVLAYFMGSPPADANIIDTGVTDIRLLIIGTPYSFSISSPVLTRFSALRHILS